MARIIRLTESDLTRIVRRVLMEDEIPGPGVQSKTPPSKYPPMRRTPPKKVVKKRIIPKACPAQKGEAYNIFKGSNVNLYQYGTNPAYDQPTMPQVCINSIMPLKSNILKVGASDNVINMFKNLNGWILFTDQIDETGQSVKLYYECGADSLKNDNLTSLINLSAQAAKAAGTTPMELQQANVYQDNVMKALQNLCMKNKEGLDVPKVQNKAFAQTGQRQSGNV